MRELFRRTWFPAGLFALPILLFELAHPIRPFPPGALTLHALIVVPIVWWRTTPTERLALSRGAASGALCGAALVAIPAIVVTVAVIVNAGTGGAGLVVVVEFALLAIAAAILVPLGTVIGIITALLQRRPPAAPIAG